MFGVTAAWEDRLSELADYRKIHGHCNVPQRYNKNTKLGQWVGTQRKQYRLQQEGKTSHMTLSRIKELESLGFKWRIFGVTTAWEDRLSELADYRKLHGHCNVPQHYNENTKLATWIATQRNRYKLHLEGTTSSLTPEYCKIHGHCNVPRNCGVNSKLGKWVNTQRYGYNLKLNGKTSPMTPSRIEKLESLGFEWKPLRGQSKGIPKKPSVDDDATSLREARGGTRACGNYST
jgi:hypothetical protein